MSNTELNSAVTKCGYRLERSEESMHRGWRQVYAMGMHPRTYATLDLHVSILCRFNNPLLILALLTSVHVHRYG